ncbi:hypothetical protein TM5383_02735 [Thalassovita mediterranea]|jgi:hypothetical protein|uniref:Uncharacterized protein n=1 Tax=Thalassovita mediterranea TaxID=340021 RepID=A0A0P1HET7_9RHOB|nr:hypothetical protein TM5383_02735 [Thalassovita mediterranea]SIS31790.1 hypothetical protein SAMN05421685_10585 [Thalassovita mediterranea]
MSLAAYVRSELGAKVDLNLVTMTILSTLYTRKDGELIRESIKDSVIYGVKHRRRCMYPVPKGPMTFFVATQEATVVPS